jgi:uncharacterized protein (TIGR04255 family)
MQGQLQISFDQTRAATASTTQMLGVAFASADDKQIFRMLAEDCTFTRNAPYTRWEDIRANLQQVWTAFCEINHATKCQRIGMRYVNRFDIPTARISLIEYFRVFPAVSSDLPTALSGFYLQTQFDLGKFALIVNQGSVPPENSDEQTSVVLDFDLFRTAGFDYKEPSQVLDVLEEMHDLLDGYFEASITDTTRELIS